MKSSAGTIKASDIWQELANYTPTVDEAGDNDAVYVTVQDITGVGILVGVGAKIGGTNSACTVKITIDGVAFVESAALLPSLANSRGMAMMLAGFAVSCKVEMKLAGAQSATFWSVALVE